jgi:hypothetical protein
MNSPFQDNSRDTQPYAPQSTNQTFDISPTPQRTFPWGCLIGGCCGVLLLGVIALGLGAWGLYSAVQSQIAKYTSTTPVELPTVDISDEEIQAIKTKMADLKTQFDSNAAPQEFVITEDEINALIAGDSDLKGRVFIEIDEGQITAKVSIPLDNIPGGKGRYFNGSASLKVKMENGVLVANVIDAEVNGEEVPEEFMSEVRKENLAKDLYKDVKTAEALQRCESLVVEADRIVLKVRKKEEKASTEDANPTNETQNVAEPPAVDDNSDAPKPI